jgi:hypothetical protein
MHRGYPAVMSIVGSFNVHRRQITFDYLDTDTDRVYRGRIAPACRVVLRQWLVQRFAGRTDVEFAVEACTGWRFVVEELEHAGIEASLAEPADTAAARGRKRRAKTDPADAQHLRELLAAGRLPTSWIPPQQVREMRAILELHKDLRDEHTAWVQRIHATLFHQGVPGLGTGGVSSPAGRARLEAGDGLSAAGRQSVAVALRCSMRWTPSWMRCTARSARSPTPSPAVWRCRPSTGSGRSPPPRSGR